MKSTMKNKVLDVIASGALLLITFFGLFPLDLDTEKHRKRTLQMYVASSYVAIICWATMSWALMGFWSIPITGLLIIGITNNICNWVTSFDLQ